MNNNDDMQSMPSEPTMSGGANGGARRPAEHGDVLLWEDGPYWAGTNIGAEKPEDYGLYFSSGNHGSGNSNRKFGQSVRPVQGFAK